MKPAGLSGTLLAIGVVLVTTEGHGGRIAAHDTPSIMRHKIHRFLAKRDDSLASLDSKQIQPNGTTFDLQSNSTTSTNTTGPTSGHPHHSHHGENDDSKSLSEKIVKDQKEVHAAEKKLAKAKAKLAADKKKLHESQENHSLPNQGIGLGPAINGGVSLGELKPTNNGTDDQTQNQAQTTPPAKQDNPIPKPDNETHKKLDGKLDSGIGSGQGTGSTNNPTIDPTGSPVVNGDSGDIV
ncbi:hypothetical protein DFH28DRAFT_1160038 [Melampsora americana]|nr:hypothetical protein DFH28DRAFT_1160038 [Melampsora americana]